MEYQQHEQVPLCEGWRRRLCREGAIAAAPPPPGFWYLASPYSKYRLGMHAGFAVACEAAAVLIRAGVAVFSPIAHSHPIAMYGRIDPLDHAVWLPMDRPMMAAAVGLIVLQADGWDASYGVRVEREKFSAARKPEVFMVPGVLPREFGS